MKFSSYVFGSALLAMSLQAMAQQTLPVARNMERAYAKGTRNPDGQPGAKYWQNSANYSIHLTFSPVSRVIAGTESIDYSNNSPDTLRQIWFKLYPNFYQAGAPRDTPIKPGDVSQGVRIESIAVDDSSMDPATGYINGTNMVLPVKDLLPGQHMQFQIRWSYVLNKSSHQRTGEVEPGSYFVAYFFPRIAVYDDIDGWNRYGYTGTQEFYNDFCHFDVHIQVPDRYVVWATGNLVNPDQVFQPGIVQRLKQAESSNGITDVITPEDLSQGDVTTAGPVHDWHYTANHVTDFVFATSDHYVWKASSLVVDPATGRRSRVDAAFDPKHKDFEEVVHFSRKTLEAISYHFPAYPYPYPHETIYDGLDQMEYPMMVNDNPLKDRNATIELTDHEIFHTLFPFYMGVNETKYAFMDEGWATIGEWLISPFIDSSVVDHYGMEPYDKAAGSEQDLPIMTLSTEQSGLSYYLNSYPKPALGYLYVRDLLGDSLFNHAVHYYMHTWEGKHPMPWDFFACMNRGAGQNLNWFWKAWFFDRGYPDLALSPVMHHGQSYRITVTNAGTKPVPVDVTCTFSDGSTRHLHRSIAVWEHGARQVTLELHSTKQMVSAALGSTYDADSRSSNDTWTLK